MPMVRIDMLAGRPPEKLVELHGRVSELVAEILDTPVERVRTIITEVPPECWGIGGVPATKARAAERLAPYKVPSRVHFVDELPRNALGKVVKPDLSRDLEEA